MATNTETSGPAGDLLETISESISLRLSLAGFVLLLITLILDTFVYGVHVLLPLLAIWSIAAIVIGLVVYTIIYIQSPD